MVIITEIIAECKFLETRQLRRECYRGEGSPSADTASLPHRRPLRYRPCMGHYYRFKRGDLVVIVSGRYEGIAL
ncbi:MAG: hypothetical protein QGI09_01440 [Dehalococcoidia bacterium]|nr:hypothetical protein [Dehalococcoidia bacterium]